MPKLCKKTPTLTLQIERNSRKYCLCFQKNRLITRFQNNSLTTIQTYSKNTELFKLQNSVNTINLMISILISRLLSTELLSCYLFSVGTGRTGRWLRPINEIGANDLGHYFDEHAFGA